MAFAAEYFGSVSAKQKTCPAIPAAACWWLPGMRGLQPACRLDAG
jgi:hypothetical protein